MLYFVIHHAVIQHFVIHHVEFAGGGGYSVCSKLSLCRTVQAFFFTFYLASTFFFFMHLSQITDSDSF